VSLVVQGADPNALNDTGKSPLYRACYNGHRNTVQLLLEVRHPSCDTRLYITSAYSLMT
jgi:ankyrin repeat protein